MVIILIYVLLGILIYALGLPVIEELQAVLCQGLEVIKGAFAVIITQQQAKIDKINKENETPESSVNVIGFAVPSDENDYDDEEEDDDG